MDKLFVFFVIALFTIAAFGQDQTQQNEDDLEDRYGWNRPSWQQFPGSNGFPSDRPNPGRPNPSRPNPGRPNPSRPNPTRPNPSNPNPARPNTAPTTPTPAATTTVSAEVRACMTSCPVTPEYNPVCGTNNMTYTNPGRLSCAQLCGVAVSLQRTSPCPTAPPVDPQ